MKLSKKQLKNINKEGSKGQKKLNEMKRFTYIV